ncbi:ribokinase [Streptomyces sp. NPDC005438]|uniref:ribokinase n=1 Tax=Streptomyces sp. NPDC005438 TaxID=3156880 RepID=UPI00339DF005
MESHELLVVGSANADLVIDVKRRPRAGETVQGGDLRTYPGGKGANQAVAAARLGARTALLARVGDDEHGRFLLDSQRRAGVDPAGVLTDPSAPTGVALITVDPSGDNSIVVSPGANGRLTEEDVAAREGLFAGVGVVCLQLEVPGATVVAAARTARAHGARVVLNPSPVEQLPPDLLELCDVLVLNEHEASVLLDADGDRSPAEQAAALRELGPREVVITLGAEGAWVSPADREGRKVPGVAVRPVDTTGAGDSFTGALAWRLALGEDLETGVRFATVVGAVSVTREGAQQSFPTSDEVEALRDQANSRGPEATA